MKQIIEQIVGFSVGKFAKIILENDKNGADLPFKNDKNGADLPFKNDKNTP